MQVHGFYGGSYFVIFYSMPVKGDESASSFFGTSNFDIFNDFALSIACHHV